MTEGQVVAEEVPPGYKRTEVGVVPEEWGIASLGEIATIATGSTPPTHVPENYGDEYLFVSPMDLGKIKYVTDTNKRLSEKGFEISRRFPANTILFVSIGSTIGKCGIASVELTSNQQINAVFPSCSFSTDYLYYILCSIAPRIRALAGEQAVPIVNKAQFSEVVVPLPPLPEQHAIASALSDTDGLIGALDALIAKKRAIKQAAMQQLLTGKIRLSGFECRWSEKPLGELASITMGQSPPSRYYNLCGDGLPLIQGNTDLVERRTVARVWTTQASKYCDAGDLLLTVRAPVGSVGIATQDSCLGRGVCGLKPLGDSAFLFQALINSEARWRILEQGSTFTSANSKQIEQFCVAAPEDEREQRAIAAVLSDMDAEIVALERRRGKAEQIKQGMMQELLTGRIRLIDPPEAPWHDPALRPP